MRPEISVSMAGWISSKLKVAENLLQQIDQQAAESLGKSEKKQYDELDFNTSPKPSSAVSLRDQLKKKTPPESNEAFVNSSTDNANSIGSSKVSIDDNSNRRKQLGKEFAKPDLNPKSFVLNDSDWTELLSTTKQHTSTKNGRANGLRGEHGVKKVRGVCGNVGLNVKSNSKLVKAGDGKLWKENGGVGDERVSVVGSDDGSPEGLKLGWNLENLGVPDGKEGVDCVNVDCTGKLDQSLNSKNNAIDADSSFRLKKSYLSGGSDVSVIDNKEAVCDEEKIPRATFTDENNNLNVENHVSGDFKSRSYSGSINVSDSDSECSSTSDSESEIDREREARIQRRRQILAAKAAAKAAEAIKEHENLVARLEGEKQSLEKIVEERAKQAAQEASELQLTMMEMMEAAELEKQKHNHTRMEVLARLAKLETTNADLAKSLATVQWNLELEVNRVVDFRRQMEVKEVVHEDPYCPCVPCIFDNYGEMDPSIMTHCTMRGRTSFFELRRRISSTCQTKNSLANFMLSKGIKFEKEMLEAEYSSLTDKVAGLQEKASKLQVNIDLAQKEIGNSTEVEVELKQRLHQMTDYLIQKQAQVEALSSDKAMLIFRIEAVTRLLDENKHLISDVSSNSRDVELGTSKASGSTLQPMFQGRIQSGKQHLGSLLRQLDAVFSAGAVFLARNPVAKVLLLVYLVCLHLWVLYILFTHSWSAEDVTSSSVLSLGNINNNNV